MPSAIRRIGVLIPPPNVAVEEELPRYVPPGIRVHGTRMFRRTEQVNYDALTEMLASVESSAISISHIQPEVILFACTSASFIRGPGTDEEIGRRIEEATGIPGIATSTAVIAALRFLRAKRVFLVTPYIEELNRMEQEFLRDNGFEVPHTVSFLCDKGHMIRAIPSSQVTDLVLSNRHLAGECDTTFISCTGLHSMDQLETLEAALKMPVISSNQATLWAGLRRMGIDASGLHGGSLLDSTKSISSSAARRLLGGQAI